MKRIAAVLMLASAFGFQQAAFGQVPQLINYQGRLVQGTNLVNGNVVLLLRLFNTPAGGLPLYEDSNTVTVVDGLYSTFIGDNTTAGSLATALANAAVYVEVVVDGVALTPRERVASVAYALVAAGVPGGAITTSMLANGAVTGGKLAGGTILNEHLAAGSVSGATLATNAITAAHVDPSTFSNTFWLLAGNAGTTPGTHFLGTTDNQPLEFKVNGARAFRVEPANTGSPNVIGGSQSNAITPGVVGATISGGGSTNFAVGYHSENSIGSDFATIGGGRGNHVDQNAPSSVIGGGSGNGIYVNADFATIGGGSLNAIDDSGDYAAIGGGYRNYIKKSAQYATISGGRDGSIGLGCEHATVGGGRGNTIDGPWCVNQTISGGLNNWIWSSENAYMHGDTIGGGEQNWLKSGIGATIGGGYQNSVGSANSVDGDYATVSGGQGNCVSGNLSTCPGGYLNWAGGYASFAAGYRAKASGRGSFVWADDQGADFAPTTDREVSFRCKNGFVLTSDSAYSLYAKWTPGSAGWTIVSDRNSKDHIEPVDGGDVLDKVARLPISEWNYIGYAQRHIGPMAQDFHALFPLNDDDKTLNEADLHGVALAAIQALNTEVRDQKSEVSRLQTENVELQKEMNALKTRLAALEER